MEKRRFKYIFAVMLIFSVVKPGLATVIYVNTLQKNAIPPEWTSFASNTTGLNIPNTLEENNLSVTLVNKFFDNSFESSAIFLAQDNSLSLFKLAETDSLDNHNQLMVDCTAPSIALWPADAGCNGLPYEKIRLTSTCRYFDVPVYNNPDTLNFRFWNGIVNHENLDIVLEKNIEPSIEPEPAPVGWLGVSIVGLASLQHRHKNKPT
jgi:hypothetical protein